MFNDLPNARPLGKVKGRMVSRFKVRVLFNNSRACATLATLDYDVIAHNASDACNLIRDLWSTRPETEVITYGPRGGETRRFIGWDSAIGNALWQDAVSQRILRGIGDHVQFAP